jgi:hypothetical protein
MRKIDSLYGIDYKQDKVLFLGSSSIRNVDRFSLQKDLHPIPVINRGFGGSTMPEAVYYFNQNSIAL